MSLKSNEAMQPVLSRESMERAEALLFTRLCLNATPRDYSMPELDDPNYIPAILKNQAC